MSRTLAVLTSLLVVTPSCASAQSQLGRFEEKRVSMPVSFSREGFAATVPIEEASISISCYSLSDARREKFAAEEGSDPVADLSCYVKDLRRKNEFTMLGLAGESLQFTPAFFWLSDVEKCAPRSFRMEAWLRGIGVSFAFANIDRSAKAAEMEIAVTAMPSAKNDRLTRATYRSYCG